MPDKMDNSRQRFNDQIFFTLVNLKELFKTHPSSLRALLRVIRHQGKARRLRSKLLALGTPVPPLLIVSTTDSCNLQCAGCYARAVSRPGGAGLSGDRIRQIVAEADQLGVSAMLLAGGEPLLQSDWLDALAAHPKLGGLVFTNGTLLPGSWLEWFNRHRQILPVISLEGNDHTTDQRRGTGVSRMIQQSLELLQDKCIPYGLSITVNRQNYSQVQSDEMMAGYIGRGCRLFVFIEYVPVESGTEELALTLTEKQAFNKWTQEVQDRLPAMFLLFPGDEEPYGGCLASARGFVYISTNGDLEPCPFAPFSDRNLKQASLAEALRSDLLQTVRSEHQLLQEGRGGCALWQNREWVAALLNQNIASNES